MKILVLIILIFSGQAQAMGDLERGILFGANGASMGTFIPEMEGEIAQLQLEYERKKVEFGLQLEHRRQSLLRDQLQLRACALNKIKGAVIKNFKIVNTHLTKISSVLAKTKNLFQGVITRTELAKELAEADFADETLAYWKDLLQTEELSQKILGADADSLQNILFNVIQTHAKLVGMSTELRIQIRDINSEIKLIEKQLE